MILFLQLKGRGLEKWTQGRVRTERCEDNAIIEAKCLRDGREILRGEPWQRSGGGNE